MNKCGGDTVPWRNPYLTCNLYLNPGQNRGCFLQTPLTDHLTIIDVHSDINQYLSLASCYVLVPATGRCPDLVKHVKSFPVSGSIFALVPMTTLPPLPYVILWHLSSSVVIHFVLQPPKTGLICKIPLINSINVHQDINPLWVLLFSFLKKEPE